jgi:NAD(P)-dependent dehydrogenase (short-subunit alcohol dehydrogenase family)
MLVPIKRLGQAMEIAKAAVYLASDESAFTVAQVMRVDGGLGKVAGD